MELSKEEKAVIEAMREGANVSVGFHGLTSVEEVDERLAMFGEEEFTVRNADLSDYEDGDKLVVFKKIAKKGQVEANLFLR